MLDVTDYRLPTKGGVGETPRSRRLMKMKLSAARETPSRRSEGDAVSSLYMCKFSEHENTLVFSKHFSKHLVFWNLVFWSKHLVFSKVFSYFPLIYVTLKNLSAKPPIYVLFSKYEDSFVFLSRSHVHTSGTKPAICLLGFYVVSRNFPTSRLKYFPANSPKNCS